MFSRETQESMRMMRERNIYRDLAFKYQSALEKILLVRPLQGAGTQDLWLAIGEIRKIAQHSLIALYDEAEEELLSMDRSRD